MGVLPTPVFGLTLTLSAMASATPNAMARRATPHRFNETRAIFTTNSLMIPDEPLQLIVQLHAKELLRRGMIDRVGDDNGKIAVAAELVRADRRPLAQRQRHIGARQRKIGRAQHPVAAGERDDIAGKAGSEKHRRRWRRHDA